MIGKSKTTKLKQGVVGPFMIYRKNQPINASQSPSSQKIFKRKTREYPTLTPTNISIRKNPRYKERESPILQIEQVSKNLGEHGQLQSLVETFTGQSARWWDTH